MSTTGYILDGKYIKRPPLNVSSDVNSTYKQWRQDDQRAKHRADVVQPYKNGKLNPEFEMLYPDQAHSYEQ